MEGIRTAESAPNLEPSDLDVSAISHHSSSSISTEEFESQRSIESSVNSIIMSVPTEAEIDDSMQALESYTNGEGSRMLRENPELQPVSAAFESMRLPEVQEAVRSILRDINVHTAILNNDAVQALLRSLMIGNSRLRLTNGNTATTAPNISQSSHNLVSVILNWLWEHMESGVQQIFEVLRTVLNTSLMSSPNPNPSFGSPPTDASGSASYTKQAISIIVLAVINLLIVIAKRAIKRKLKI